MVKGSADTIQLTGHAKLNSMLATITPVPAALILRWLAQANAEPPLPPDQWLTLLERCRALRVGPLAVHRLAADPRAGAAGLQVELDRYRKAMFFRTARVLGGGLRAIEALTAAGVPVAGFKGIAAIGWLQDGRPERDMADIDLLVAPARAEAALAALAAAGFVLKVEGVSTAALRAFSRSSPGSGGNEAIALCDAGGAEIDLHWKVGRVEVAEVIEAALPVRVLARMVPLVSSRQSLLFSAQHALRNDFLPSVVVRDLLDAAGWFRRLADDPHEQRLALDEARRTGLEPALAAMACVLADFGIAGGEWLPPSPTSRALADLFHAQNNGDPINRDLVYLCSPLSLIQIVQGLCLGGRSYLRTMRATEDSNGQGGTTLRRRLWRLVRSVWASPRGQWRRLRELAAVKARLN